ncbi:Ig-like domain-containing protein [Podarcis lilfordi]|uniref:Ig-like domain-containing protein n=1 Tax=Podarcis lilfordi TaxID=74358 RepID=A0AA35K297_9SAUR|nr:Ig-like domain-containing protein [Podarcis lilfordi]
MQENWVPADKVNFQRDPSPMGRPQLAALPPASFPNSGGLGEAAGFRLFPLSRPFFGRARISISRGDPFGCLSGGWEGGPLPPPFCPALLPGLRNRKGKRGRSLRHRRSPPLLALSLRSLMAAPPDLLRAKGLPLLLLLLGASFGRSSPPLAKLGCWFLEEAGGGGSGMSSAPKQRPAILFLPPPGRRLEEAALESELPPEVEAGLAFQVLDPSGALWGGQASATPPPWLSPDASEAESSCEINAYAPQESHVAWAEGLAGGGGCPRALERGKWLIASIQAPTPSSGSAASCTPRRPRLGSSRMGSAASPPPQRCCRSSHGRRAWSPASGARRSCTAASRRRPRPSRWSGAISSGGPGRWCWPSTEPRGGCRWPRRGPSCCWMLRAVAPPCACGAWPSATRAPTSAPSTCPTCTPSRRSSSRWWSPPR